MLVRIESPRARRLFGEASFHSGSVLFFDSALPSKVQIVADGGETHEQSGNGFCDSPDGHEFEHVWFDANVSGGHACLHCTNNGAHFVEVDSWQQERYVLLHWESFSRINRVQGAVELQLVFSQFSTHDLKAKFTAQPTHESRASLHAIFEQSFVFSRLMKFGESSA